MRKRYVFVSVGDWLSSSWRPRFRKPSFSSDHTHTKGIRFRKSPPWKEFSRASVFVVQCIRFLWQSVKTHTKVCVFKRKPGLSYGMKNFDRGNERCWHSTAPKGRWEGKKTQRTVWLVVNLLIFKLGFKYAICMYANAVHIVASGSCVIRNSRMNGFRGIFSNENSYTHGEWWLT